MFSFFGKKIKVSKENLEDYIGSEGKYTPIVKSMTVRYPHEILKELSLVDTPGFNDPIISREKEAEKFLSEADGLIFLLYAGRAFDATDKYLIVNKIAKLGTGGIILAINKYDELLEDAGSMEEVERYVKEIYLSIIEEIESESIKEVLNKAPIIKLSSLMALLGYLPQSKIEADEDLRWYYEEFLEKFPFLKTKEDFIKYSGILEIDEEIRKLVREYKVSALKNKVSTIIIGKLNQKMEEIRKEMFKLEQELEKLNKDKMELEKEKEEFDNFLNHEYYLLLEKSFIVEKIDKLINWRKEELQEDVERIFKGIYFRDIGWVDTNYSTYVKSVVDEAIYESQNKIRRKVHKLIQELKGILRKYIVDKGLNVANHPIVFKHAKYSGKLIEDILEGIQKNLETNLEEIRLNIKIESPPIRRFLFFGDSPEEAKNKAQNYKMKVHEEVANQIERIFKNLNRYIGDRFIRENIEEPLRKNILEPIQEALKNVLEAYGKQEGRYKELEKELKFLNSELERLQKLNVEVENQLREI
jgi:signal recognition particle receptor subunit beta